jgi:P4 family phage/plasmid primase-like protien
MPQPSTSIITYLEKYAHMGYTVVPVFEKQYAEAGLNKVTKNDELQLKEWKWRYWDDSGKYGIGILTYPVNDLWVLDVDKKHGGLEKLKELHPNFKELYNTRTIQSGGGGLHFYFKKPKEYFILRDTESFEGFDIIGQNRNGTPHFIVAPPSLHCDTGFPYTEFHETSKETILPPDWLLNILIDKKIAVTEIPKDDPSEYAERRYTDETTAWGKKELERQCTMIRNAVTSTRNSTLNKAAFYIGQLIGGGEIEMNEGITAVEEAGKDAGLSIQEVKQTATKHAILDGMKKPKAAPKDKEKPMLFSGKYHDTDYGNGLRLRDFAGNDIRYIPEMNRWYVWDGKRWKEDNGNAIDHKIIDMVVEMQRQAANLPRTDDDKNERAAALKYSIKMENNKQIKETREGAQKVRELEIKPDALDSNNYLLNTLTGTVDLENNVLKYHEREDYITHLIEHEIDPEPPTVWLKFLDEIFKEDAELIHYMQKSVGYSLTGDVSEDVIWFLYGSGRNGKSTFLNVLRNIFGEYAETLRAESLMAEKRSGRASPDVVKLKGKRFVTSSEGEDNQKLAEGKIKNMTGGDPMTGSFLFQNEITFMPTHHVFFATNHKPRINGTEDGIWRRIKLIPFDYRVPKSKIDKHLEDKLMEEAPKILAWAIQGCAAWRKEGLDPEPKRVQQATNEYKSESDIVGLFIKDLMEEDETGKALYKETYARFRDWCIENGLSRPMSQQKFGSNLEEKGYIKDRTGGSSKFYVFGLVFKRTEPEEDPREYVVNLDD